MNRSVVILLILNVVLGTFIVVSSHHWFLVWVGLELNTLCLVPILCLQFTPRGVESTVKYFLIQLFSAAIILNVVLINVWLNSSWSVDGVLSDFTSFLFSLSIGLKLGLFPCHYWFPDVLQGVSFEQGLILSTWQKIAPFVILINISEGVNYVFLVVIGVVSVWIGGWGGLNQVQVRKILAFSSISHVGWICSILVYSKELSIMMMIIYLVLNSGVFVMASSVGVFTLGNLSRLSYYNVWLSMGLSLGVLSLGGLPPLGGFLSKFIALQCLISNGVYLMAGFLVMGSLLSLFFYLRISFNSSMNLFPQHSFSLLVWREMSGLNLSLVVWGIVLSVLVSLSSFGLVFVCLLMSFF
uniref:NADH-ubiquinone oxidoreductase chain 2 n=1 Tax=Euretaster insignis TaxID=478253 RepID=A0A7S8CUN1_9ECHI|nr:NADH dehydrogenase subunit 2 [Euretaster insignis]QPC56446.1 NADH dehydrogenase subunit 2 [Euretaster insignis]